MSVTIVNTKSAGRRMARELMHEGMPVESLRATATDLDLNPSLFPNRHRVAGFVQEVNRLARIEQKRATQANDVACGVS